MSKASPAPGANVVRMRPLEVVVRGHARSRYPAERANVSLAANLEGTDREGVYRRAVGLQEPLAPTSPNCVTPAPSIALVQ